MNSIIANATSHANTLFLQATRQPTAIGLLALLALLLALTLLARRGSAKSPPVLGEPVPYVYNTVQYLTNAGAFMDRVIGVLNKHQVNVVKYSFGMKPAYFVTGTKNAQQIFGSPRLFDGDFLALRLMDKFWGLNKLELSKFSNDKTGRFKTPVPGTESATPYRYWVGHDKVNAEFLANPKYANGLGEHYLEFLESKLDEQPLGEWNSLDLFASMKRIMVECSSVALFGTKMVELNPGFVDCFWDLEPVSGSIAWGLPRFLIPDRMAKKDRLHGMTRKQVDFAWKHFDWNGPDADSSWDPLWGSAWARQSAQWLRNGGFSNHAIAGHTFASLIGLHSNSVPLTTWAIMEAIRDPTLFQALREETLASMTKDPKTGRLRIDVHQLIKKPLLQSVYIETLRSHVFFNVTRETKEPVMLDGFCLEKGALVQLCSRVAHYDEEVWGAEGHPASEFWAWRHTNYLDVVDKNTGALLKPLEFVMKGRQNSFFPYGGGHVICPGRYFAKQEIILTLGLIVTKFDIEFGGWALFDGAPSDRPAKDDERYAAFLAMHPDREMKIRWKRQW